MGEKQISMLISQAIPYIITNIFLLIFGFGRKSIAESQINNIVGYRTKRSKQSPEAWKEAHLYFGKVCIAISIILLSSAYWVLQLKSPLAIIILFLFIAISVLLTEIHLARNLPSNPSSLAQKTEERQAQKDNSEK